MPVRFQDAGDGALRASAHGGHALFTARAGGVSEGPFAQLNLGPWTGDDPAALAENRRRVEVTTARPLQIGRQIHEAAVAVHRAGDAVPELDGVDAHVTDGAESALAVLAADCVPVVLLAPGGVAAAHAGWRGLAGGVLEATAAELAALTGAAELGEAVALIGPSAGPCCYETGDEVHAAFAARPRGAASGRHVDLPAIAEDILRGAGIGEVVQAGRCTICDPRYFSHRASGGTTGRQAGIAWRN